MSMISHEEIQQTYYGMILRLTACQSGIDHHNQALVISDFLEEYDFPFRAKLFRLYAFLVYREHSHRWQWWVRYADNNYSFLTRPVEDKKTLGWISIRRVTDDSDAIIRNIGSNLGVGWEPAAPKI
jgi:hypothetical protein